MIDHSKPLQFTFDGRSYSGFQGDTLASALLANGVRVLGCSFKHHRLCGVGGAWFDDPNAIFGVTCWWWAAACSGALLVEGQSPADWIAKQQSAILAASRRILTDTTAFGVFDHNMVGLAQDHSFAKAPSLWRIRARRILMATGRRRSVVHLWCHAGGKLDWDETISAFVSARAVALGTPPRQPPNTRCPYRCCNRTSPAKTAGGSTCNMM